MVVYITSMPAVRETHEQCQRIVLVLRAHQVAFVAKDIYLHPDYNEELRLRLGEPTLTVPQVPYIHYCLVEVAYKNCFLSCISTVSM